MLTATPKKQRALTLRLLAAMGLVWLNMVLNPCAMALSEMDQDCPHCPPVEHCDEQATSGCRYIDSIDSDGRTHQTRAPDFSDYAFSLPAEPAPVMAIRFNTSSIVDYLRITGPPDRPLYIRYCVYLK